MESTEVIAELAGNLHVDTLIGAMIHLFASDTPQWNRDTLKTSFAGLRDDQQRELYTMSACYLIPYLVSTVSHALERIRNGDTVTTLNETQAQELIDQNRCYLCRNLDVLIPYGHDLCTVCSGSWVE